MKFTIHIKYKDGSNPFVSLGGWDKKDIIKCVNKNYLQAQEIKIWCHGYFKIELWFNSKKCKWQMFGIDIDDNIYPIGNAYTSLGAVLNRMEKIVEWRV